MLAGRQTLTTILSFAILLSMTTVAFAGDRERGMRRGPSPRRGNENSEPISQISVGSPSYGGNGCPQGTMRVVFAPDHLSFSLLFDQFVAEVSDPMVASKDVMACDALIPLQIPNGMQMRITRVDLRGFAAIPERGRGMLQSLFNFRGRGGDGTRMNLRYNFDGPLTENYEISSDAISPGESETSPCGGSFNLRIANQLRVRTPKKGERTSLTLDSIDGSAEATYFVAWQSCRAR